MHSTTLGTHHAVCWLFGLPGTNEFVLGGNGWGHRLQPGVARSLRDRMLRREATGRTLRPLDPYGPARTGLGRQVLCALGIPGSVHRPFAASHSHFHRVAGGNRPDAAQPVPYLYVSRIVAVVLCAGMVRYENGRELAVVGEVLSSIRSCDRSGAGSRDCVVRLVSLAEPNRGDGVGSDPFAPLKVSYERR